MAEPRRAVVSRADRQGNPTRRVPQRPDLTTAIENYLNAHNDDPKPFVWTASIDSILEKVSRCKAVLETVH
jgi:hypothetical protein